MDYSEITMMDGQDYFRLLLPLRVDKPCLKCHASQGYKEADLRGGISISLSIAYFHDNGVIGEQVIFIGHSAIWAIGMFGIFFGYSALARREVSRKKVEVLRFPKTKREQEEGVLRHYS